MFEARKWVILTASEAEDIEYDKVGISNADTLTWNLDNTKTFVKYEGNKPRFLYGKDTLTHSEILVELSKSEWGESPDPPE